MVEKQTDKVNISDTGVLSKEVEITKSCLSGEEVTDYWDISGAMETQPGGVEEKSGNMKLQNTAEGLSEERDEKRVEIHDNVSTDSAIAGIKSDAMKTSYCENGISAIKISECGLNNNLNNNNCNQNGDDFVKTQGDCISKEYSDCKNSTKTVEDMNKDNSNCNTTSHLKEPDIVGTHEATNKAVMNGVNDIGSNNSESSGAQDKGTEADNKPEISIRDEMMQDSECTEERFRIDRKKLEQMLQAAAEGRGQSGEEFFKKIMDDTKTHITWPSKLKIGAKSKKDPHIRICGKPDNIKEARQRIMQSLDTKSNRVTVKMDVSHTEHSHVIGKGGNNIKRVMQETGCHIHFPDSNRNNVAEKSNQVSITGHAEGVESARTKIRSLLPIVLMFELPNTGIPMPDPNSPMIQHLVQTYGISIQFKQRAKSYSTTCTVRGSSDNLDGLKNGVQTLLNHVAGGQLPVTTQIEIAPQHHAYMVSKTGRNINTIIQSTGARIIFPDPNALPKKSTVYVNGNIDSVLLARHQLMGCLPILLMFDTKDESNSARQDGVTIAQMMESLDIFINIKLKPKQPSKTIIIKSMEYNIYNMFQARAKLLGLDSAGIPRPNNSQLSTSLAPNSAVSPVILLAQSHVPTPTVQTHVLSLTEPKTITPLQCAVLNTPYVITHSVPSNPATPRPLSALSVHTPAQSPYPSITPTNSNIVHSLTPNHLANKEILRRESADANSNRDPLSPSFTLVNNNMSPPTSIPVLSTSQNTFHAGQAMQQTSHLQQRNIELNSANVMPANRMRSSSYQNYENAPEVLLSKQTENHMRYPPTRGYEENGRSKIFTTQNGIMQSNLNMKTLDGNNTLLSSNYNPRHAANNQYGVTSASFQRDYDDNVHGLPPSFSSAVESDNLHDKNRKITEHLNQHLRNSHYNREIPISQEEQILQQRFGEGGNTRTPLQQSRPSSSAKIVQSLSQNIYSPDSISGSRNSLGSERNSPMSTISDRFMDKPNSRLGYDQFDDHSRHRTPSPAGQSNNVFQPLVNRDVNSLSPLSGRTQHHRSPPQIILNRQSGNAPYESTDAKQLDQNVGDVANILNKQGMQDISSGPPPGFEGFQPHPKDYDQLRQLAQKAMENKPVVSEIRTPTDVWSGCGFSKSMPFQMKEDLKKVASRFRNNLPPTFENGDINPDRNQPSPVNEEDEDSLDMHSAAHLKVPMSHQNVANSSKGGSSLKAWRRKQVNMNLSLGGHVGLNFMGGMQRRQQNHSAFTPVHPNESLNRTSNSPKGNPQNESLSHSRTVISSPFNKSGSERTLKYPHSENPLAYDSRMNMSSAPTIQDSLGLNVTAGTKNRVEADIADVLNRLDLSKYISVFQQQEVDFQTFLTLTESDLKELGISTFGPRKKILLAIKDLNIDRDVFSVNPTNDPLVHENPSDHMLQLQRLQLQQHRDNPHPKNHLEVPQSTMDRRVVYHEDAAHQNMSHDKGRQINSGRLWQNSRVGISNSGRW